MSSDTYDVFISYRFDDREIAEALHQALSSVGLTSVYCGMLDKNGVPAIASSGRLGPEQRDLILSSPLTVAIVAHRGFEPNERGECQALEELRCSVLERDNKRNGQTSTLFLYAPNPDGKDYERHPRLLNVERMRRQRKATDYFRNEKSTILTSHPAHQRDQFEIEIKSFAVSLAENEAKFLLPRGKDDAPMPTTTHGNVAEQYDTIDSYLTTDRFECWVAGRLPEARPNCDPSAASSPLDMPMPLHIDLCVSENRDQSRHSALSTIFAPPESGEPCHRRPLFLRGGPGSGKTVTLAMAAAIATLAHRDFQLLPARENELVATHRILNAAGGPGDEARRAGRRMIPVMLSAQTILDLSTKADRARLQIDDVLSAIGFEAFLDKPLLLLIDDISDLTPADASNLVKSACAFLGDRATKGITARVVLAGSSLSTSALDSVRCTDLQSPTREEIVQFVKLLVKSSVDQERDSETASFLLQSIREFSTDPATSPLVENLGLLNAYCRTICEGAASISTIRKLRTRRGFCEALVDFGLERCVSNLTHENRQTTEINNAFRAFCEQAAVAELHSDDDGLLEGEIIDLCEDAIANLDADVSTDNFVDAVVRSGLLSKRGRAIGTEYRIQPNILSSYFVGAEYARSIQEQQLNPDQLCDEVVECSPENSEQILGFTFDILLVSKSRQARNFALELAETLVDQSEIAVDASVEQKDSTELLERATARFRLACSLFNDGAPRKLRRSRELNKLNTRLTEQFMELREFAGPVDRAALIDALMHLARRDEHHQTRIEVHRLLDKIDGPAQETPRWIDTGITSECGGKIQLASRPVLVADYAHFLSIDAPDPWGGRDGILPMLADTESESRHGFEALPFERWAKLSPYLATPMAQINWIESIAFARWAQSLENEISDEPGIVRLLSKSEWQELAEWASGGAKYVWGGDAPSRSLRETPVAHYELSKLRSYPTPIGTFPSYGAAGLLDFSSNVGSWLLDAVSGHEQWIPEKPDIDSDQTRATMTSFGWDLEIVETQTNQRYRNSQIKDRWNSVGLRLAKIVK